MKPSKIRLCLYDADPDVPGLTPIGRVYADTPRNRELLRRAIQTYGKLAAKRADVDMCMGVFLVRSRKRTNG